MNTFQVISGFIFVVAVFGYLNHRFVRLPDAVGITAIGVIVSIAAALLGRSDAALADQVRRVITDIDFPQLLLHGLLGPLLFAGSLHIDIDDVAAEKWLILTLGSVGVLLSTALVGAGFYGLMALMGSGIPLLHCLLFGAVVSPTDPVAVLAVLKRVGIPKSLDTRIAGESLVNDGTGVVVFVTLLELISGGDAVGAASTARLFATEVLGGAAFGLLAGHVGVWMLRGVQSYPVEILITLALATGGYAMADAAHVSAPIAVVMMGLLVGHHGKRDALSKNTRQRLFDFWEVLDELLNLLLFGLIGLQLMTLSFSRSHAVVGVAAIVIVLLARLISVSGPILATPRLRAAARSTITIMTWGGLRGGLSIALALSLPAFAGREIVVAATYAVVIFSILIQATTLRRIAAHALGAERDAGADDAALRQTTMIRHASSERTDE